MLITSVIEFLLIIKKVALVIKIYDSAFFVIFCKLLFLLIFDTIIYVKSTKNLKKHDKKHDNLKIYKRRLKDDKTGKNE